MKAIRALRTNTREGFRLVVAWFTGVVSFGLLSSLTENTAHGEGELILVLCLIGLGVIALALTLILEGLKPVGRSSSLH